MSFTTNISQPVSEVNLENWQAEKPSLETIDAQGQSLWNSALWVIKSRLCNHLTEALFSLQEESYVHWVKRHTIHLIVQSPTFSRGGKRPCP